MTQVDVENKLYTEAKMIVNNHKLNHSVEYPNIRNLINKVLRDHLHEYNVGD